MKEYNFVKINIIKEYFVCFLLFNMYLVSLAQEEPFFKTEDQYKEKFAFSKVRNKPLFLYIHIDNCGSCIQMEKKVFADPTVSAYLDSNFVFCNINAKKGEGIDANKIYKVRSFPTCIITDSSGTILGKKIGFLSTTDFLYFCNKSVSKTTSLAGMRAIYSQGNRSSDFLYDYCYLLYGANEIDSLSINEYLATQKPEYLISKENIQFIYTFAVTNTNANYDVSSLAFNLLNSKPELFYQYYDTIQVRGRIVWVASLNFQNALKDRNFHKMHECLMILSEYVSENYYRVNDVNGVNKSIILYSKNDHLANNILFQSLLGDEKKYSELIKKFEDENSNNPDALNGMAWTFAQNITNKQKLAEAEKWIEKAIAMNNNYAFNDTYAWLLSKEEKYKLALEIAEKAVSLAKAENEDFSETTRLIEQIKTEME